MNAKSSRWRRDDGSAVVQTVITVPVVGLLAFVIVQFVLYYHAAEIAHMAAQQGLEAARVQSGTRAAGQAAAEQYLAELDRSTLHNGQVSVQRGAREVRVEVTGTAEQVVPFLHLSIHAAVTGPAEALGSTP